MYSALYFPHTEVRSNNIIKKALLTWDKLETIIPDSDYRPQYDGVVARAMEIIGKPRPPRKADKDRVHILVEDLIRQGVPETFAYRASGRDYEMWPRKLAPETWDLLRGAGLVGGTLPNSDYPASQSAGLTLMSIIADVMAGQTRTRVTDRGLAYATIANAPNVPQAAKVTASGYEQIIPVTFKVMGIEDISMERLVARREREEKSSKSQDYRRLRHNYVDRLEKHVKEAGTYPAGSSDRQELDRVFEQAMEDDFADLKAELGIAKREALFSKEALVLVSLGVAAVGMLAAGGVGAVSAAIAGAVKAGGVVASVGGPVAVLTKYGAARRKILRQHPMAYLYEIDRRRR